MYYRAPPVLVQNRGFRTFSLDFRLFWWTLGYESRWRVTAAPMPLTSNFAQSLDGLLLGVRKSNSEAGFPLTYARRRLRTTRC